MATGEVHNLNVSLGNGTLAVGTTVIGAFAVPANSLGGGITLTAVHFWSNAAIAAASAPVFELVGLGTGFAVAGTLTTVLGSAAWTAGTARVGTISTAFVDPDTYAYVGVQRKQTAANADTPVVGCSIQYVMGY
jgi:hypothetical protein